MKFHVSGYVYNTSNFVVEADSEKEAIGKSFNKDLVRLENPSIADYKKSFIYTEKPTDLTNVIVRVDSYNEREDTDEV